jgi:hypothetical protein
MSYDEPEMDAEAQAAYDAYNEKCYMDHIRNKVIEHGGDYLAAIKED